MIMLKEIKIVAVLFAVLMIAITSCKKDFPADALNNDNTNQAAISGQNNSEKEMFADRYNIRTLP